MSIMTVLLMGCGNTTVPLAEVFRQEQLEAQTIQIVDFVKYGNTVVNGQKIEEEDYAVVMVKAQYEKQNVTFQVGYDAEMKVVGLYMK